MTTIADVRVEPYTSKAYRAVVALLAAAGWARDAIPTSAIMLSAGRMQTAFVAYTPDRQLIGFARIISDKTTVSYLAEIAVDASWQDQGIGRKLIESCRHRFPKARLDLLSTADARTFYERVGFVSKPGYRRWPQ